MFRLRTLIPASSLQFKFNIARVVALTLAVACAFSTTLQAETKFHSKLELDMTIPSGAIHNKFGFATSFPKPDAAPPFSIKNGNPGGEKVTKHSPDGSANLRPQLEADAMARRDVPKGRGMKLFLEGDTNAQPKDGSFGQAEGWLSGVAKFRLGNLTGRPDFLPTIPQKLNIDLEVKMLRDMLAHASNDLQIADKSNAKIIYSLTNTSTDEVIIPETILMVDDDDVKPDDRHGPITETIAATVTIPANTFYNLELFGHIYVAGQSIGAGRPNPPPANPPAGSDSIPNLPDRMGKPLPDDDMRLPLAENVLFGDVSGSGGGVLVSSAGVIGEHPLALYGLNTVMLDDTITSSDKFFDLEVAVEVPFNGFSQVAIQDVMAAASGFHGQVYNLQLGTGVGGEFQPSLDPTMLSLAGIDSPFAPEELSGAYQLLGFNDPVNPTQMMFQGELQPGQLSQFEMVANLSDAVDGEIDGMAHFTLRKAVQGFGGDYNNDLATNLGDLALWHASYGTDDRLADGDASGFISGGDFLNWQRNFGRGFGTSGGTLPASIGAVPEPSSVALALGSIIALAWGRSRGNVL